MVWVGVSAADVARRYVGGTIRNNDRNVLRSVVIMRKGSVHTDRPSKAMVSDARLKLVKDLERIEDVTLSGIWSPGSRVQFHGDVLQCGG